MKDFDKWFKAQDKVLDDVADEALPAGLERDDTDGKLYYHCCMCDKRVELECDLAELPDSPSFYCGGSPRCCP